MKRKGFGDIFDSHSAKSRRLDGELLKCMQEDLRAGGAEVIEGMSSLEPCLNGSIIETSASAVDAMPVVCDSEEKAIVLYCPPPDAPFLKSPSSPELPTIIVNSDLIPGLRDHIFWPRNSKAEQIKDEMAAEKSSDVLNKCLAVVPWVASQPTACSMVDGQQTMLLEPMEAEEIQGEMMDIENTGAAISTSKLFEYDGSVERAKGFHWQQHQHQCMAELLQNKYTPVTW